MRISVEKASDGTFIIEVPAKKRKDAKGNMLYPEDLKYTASDETEALKIIGEALKEVKAPVDEYKIGFDEASKVEQPVKK